MNQTALDAFPPTAFVPRLSEEASEKWLRHYCTDVMSAAQNAGVECSVCKLTLCQPQVRLFRGNRRMS